jgi:EPS-associated MarR family transcriptional regulator
LQLLRQLALEPKLNQRRLAKRLGVSLGKANYCVQALIRKGHIKIRNFRRNDNKLAYAYVLTPRGLREKSRLTIAFLKRKQEEFERLQAEIASLRAEVDDFGPELSRLANSKVSRDAR